MLPASPCTARCPRSPTADAGRLEASPCRGTVPHPPSAINPCSWIFIQAHNRPTGPSNGRTALRVGSRASPRHKGSPSYRLSGGKGLQRESGSADQAVNSGHATFFTSVPLRYMPPGRHPYRAPGVLDRTGVMFSNHGLVVDDKHQFADNWCTM